MEAKSTEMELLIKRITSEVVKGFMEGSMNANYDEAVIGENNKQILVLVPDFITNLPEFFSFIKDKHPGYKLVVAAESKVVADASRKIKELGFGDINDILNIREDNAVDKLSQMINEFYATYFLLPGVKQLEAIVNGDDTGFFEKLIIYLVLHQKSSGIILDYNILNLPSNNLTRKLSEIYNLIRDMGMSINILNDELPEKNNKSSQKGKQLITERDVNELNSRGIRTIACGTECIITPLAKDRIRELKMKIT